MVAHVYHTNDLVELPDIAAYAYQDVHVQSTLRPACAPPAQHFFAKISICVCYCVPFHVSPNSPKGVPHVYPRNKN